MIRSVSAGERPLRVSRATHATRPGERKGRRDDPVIQANLRHRRGTCARCRTAGRRRVQRAVAGLACYERREPGFVRPSRRSPGIKGGQRPRDGAAPGNRCGRLAACAEYLSPAARFCVVGLLLRRSFTWLAAGEVGAWPRRRAYYAAMGAGQRGVKPLCPVIVSPGRIDAQTSGPIRGEKAGASRTLMQACRFYIYGKTGRAKGVKQRGPRARLTADQRRFLDAQAERGNVRAGVTGRWDGGDLG